MTNILANALRDASNAPTQGVMVSTDLLEEAATEIDYLRALINAWCDAVDAEINAPYPELQKTLFDRHEAEQYLRNAMGR